MGACLRVRRRSAHRHSLGRQVWGHVGFFVPFKSLSVAQTPYLCLSPPQRTLPAMSPTASSCSSTTRPILIQSGPIRVSIIHPPVSCMMWQQAKGGGGGWWQRCSGEMNELEHRASSAMLRQRRARGHCTSRDVHYADLRLARCPSLSQLKLMSGPPPRSSEMNSRMTIHYTHLLSSKMFRKRL